MKIIQIIPYSYTIHPGWLEKIADTLGRWLSQQFWHEVIVAASDISTDKIIDIKENMDLVWLSYKQLYLPSFELVAWFPVPKFWSRAYTMIIKQIRWWKPDCIITHTRFFLQSFLGGLLAKILWCKWVHIEHGSWFVTWYPRYIRTCAWLFDWTIGLWIFRQCDAIVTISESHKTFIKNFTKKDPVVIYNPIEFTPQEKIENAIPHIWFVGRLVPLKWVNLLIDALFEIQDKQRYCTIVWDWSERQELEEQVRNHGLEDRIKFVWADDRSNWLHKFDILINPSYQEWLPTTVVEWLLASCIVIATDVGGTREISDQDDLIIISAWDRKDLSTKILNILEWNNQSIYVWKSYNIIQQKFSYESSIKRYNEVLQSFLK